MKKFSFALMCLGLLSSCAPMTLIEKDVDALPLGEKVWTNSVICSSEASALAYADAFAKKGASAAGKVFNEYLSLDLCTHKQLVIVVLSERVYRAEGAFGPISIYKGKFLGWHNKLMETPTVFVSTKDWLEDTECNPPPGTVCV